MNRNKFTWLVYLIIGLGVLGLTSQLFSNPGNLLKNLFMMVVFGGVIFGVIYFLFLRKRTTSNSNEMKKYKMAVKQSKSRYNNHNERSFGKNRSHSSNTKGKLNRRAPHLRVIEGNKSKRKNRTTF